MTFAEAQQLVARGEGNALECCDGGSPPPSHACSCCSLGREPAAAACHARCGMPAENGDDVAASGKIPAHPEQHARVLNSKPPRSGERGRNPNPLANSLGHPLGNPSGGPLNPPGACAATVSVRATAARPPDDWHAQNGGSPGSSPESRPLLHGAATPDFGIFSARGSEDGNFPSSSRGGPGGAAVDLENLVKDSPFLDLGSPMDWWDVLQMVLMAPVVLLKLLLTLILHVPVFLVMEVLVFGNRLSEPLPAWRARWVRAWIRFWAGAFLRIGLSFWKPVVTGMENLEGMHAPVPGPWGY